MKHCGEGIRDPWHDYWETGRAATIALEPMNIKRPVMLLISSNFTLAPILMKGVNEGYWRAQPKTRLDKGHISRALSDASNC